MRLKVVFAGSNCFASVRQSCYYDVCVFEHVLSRVFFSCQTRGSTHVWPPAPVARPPGVPSWRSKVKCFNVSTVALRANVLHSHITCFGFFRLSLRVESGGAMVTKSHSENELPGPPSKPQVTDVTKNSVSLSWQPGLAGVSPVSSFVIEAFRSVFLTSCIFTLNLFSDIIPCNQTCCYIP